MKFKLISLPLLILGAVMLSGLASANGLGEDSAWKFESPWMKAHKLNVAVTEEKLSAGAFKSPTTNIDCGPAGCQFGDKVAGDKVSTSNCINCVDYDISVTGDNNTVTENDVTQTADRSAQVGQANTEIDLP